MFTDRYGLRLTTDSIDAAAAFTDAITAYLTFRTDGATHVTKALEADPTFALGHVLKGYFSMLSYKSAYIALAFAAFLQATKYSSNISSRETAHIEALGTWVSGDVERTLEIWKQICTDYPHDLLAFRLHHLNAFWLGRPEVMQTEVERILPHWNSHMPGWGIILACRSFAHEEAGNYPLAESSGRLAIEINQADLWAAHAVAHVYEMQGKRREGIDWLTQLEPFWVGANNQRHHLLWHRALFHLEQREFDIVLGLYDNGFRNLASPVTAAQPDLYIDVQNAASMLFRLERHGVDVGERWTELADHAEKRIGDCLSSFTLPHWMMALAASGRASAAHRMIAAMRDFSVNGTCRTGLTARVALPVCQAVLANRQGRHDEALDLMRPVLNDLYLLGGSHAQQDVLHQLFLDSALKADRPSDIRFALDRVKSMRQPVPVTSLIGYATAAALYES